MDHCCILHSECSGVRWCWWCQVKLLLIISCVLYSLQWQSCSVKALWHIFFPLHFLLYNRFQSFSVSLAAGAICFLVICWSFTIHSCLHLLGETHPFAIVHLPTQWKTDDNRRRILRKRATSRDESRVEHTHGVSLRCDKARHTCCCCDFPYTLPVRQKFTVLCRHPARITAPLSYWPLFLIEKILALLLISKRAVWITSSDFFTCKQSFAFASNHVTQVTAGSQQRTFETFPLQKQANKCLHLIPGWCISTSQDKATFSHVGKATMKKADTVTLKKNLTRQMRENQLSHSGSPLWVLSAATWQAGTGVTEAPGKLSTCDLLQLDNSCQCYTHMCHGSGYLWCAERDEKISIGALKWEKKTKDELVPWVKLMVVVGLTGVSFQCGHWRKEALRIFKQYCCDSS